MPDAAIELRGLSKRFGARTAVDHLTLSIPGASTTVLMGRSGAGKTTLLRLVAGLERPDSGQVLIGGNDVRDVPPARRGLAYVNQGYSLYPQLTVRKNLEAALAPLRLARRERLERIEEVLEQFAIGDLQRHLPSQLSGGQSQRVAFAKAVVRRPACLLLDEPLSQLDPPLKAEMRRLLREVVRGYSPTLLLVTHDPLDAMDLADQLVIIRAGRLEQQDAPEAVYGRPTSRDAAELTSLFGVNRIEFDRSSEGDACSDDKTLVFRPEAVCWSEREAGVGAIALNATAVAKRSLGFAWIVDLQVGHQAFTALCKDADLVCPSETTVWVIPVRDHSG